MKNKYPLSVIPGYFGSRPGIQHGIQLSAEVSDDDILFARQLGIEWVMTGLNDRRDHNAESYRYLKKKFEDRGLMIYRLANPHCHNMPEVTLGLEDREKKIDEYITYIRNLGKAGIYYATYAHMANGIWSSGTAEVRGGAEARALRLDGGESGHWAGEIYRGPLTHGRKYTEEEIWENFRCFIEKIAPVAEESGVYIGIHPDDPPLHSLGGIPRCVFGSFDGYKRALKMAGSPNIGVCLCIGCWLEGAEKMGTDVIGAIRHFGREKKLFKVHFRNVSVSPGNTGFTETFLDDGYMDMSRVMRTLREIDFDGAVISDHIPKTVGGRRVSEALAAGYIKGLIQSVQEQE